MPFPVQRSLFPDAFEVEADALAALEDLDAERGLACVREARRRDPALANLDELEGALFWLGPVLADGPHDRAAVARAFLALPRAGLEPGAARFADRALARFGLRIGPPLAFLDAEERVPAAALRLVLDQAEAARRELGPFLAGREERAELWGWLGDACVAADRADEANACYVRALLLDAARADLFRIRDPRLRALWAELSAVHPEPVARELVFPHAWMRGILLVPAPNDWLAGQKARLMEETRASAGASDAARLRRFALLLYVDRSRARGAFDLAQREEMQALAPDLYGSVVAILSEREKRAP